MYTKLNMGMGLVVIMVFVLSIFTLACGSSQPTSTPVPIQQSAQPVNTQVATSPTATATPKQAFSPTPSLKSGPQYGGTLRIATLLDADNLDPRIGNRRAEVPVQLLVYDTVVRLGPDWKLLPGLAKSWQISNDGKTVTFSLAQGIKFQDGTEFNANVLKWNFEWALDPKTGHGQRSTLEAMGIDNISVEDDHTVSLHLKNPYRPVVSTLTVRPGFIPSPSAIGKLGKDFGRKPVGAGPFQLQEWNPGQSITLVRNPNFFEAGKPYLDTIVLQNSPDPQVRLAMLRTKDIDLTEDLESSNIDVIRRNPDVTLDEHESGRAWGSLMNVTKAPFNNKPLRQAIALAIDRQKIIDTVFLGGGRLASGYEAAGWAYNANLTIPYDVQKAKAKVLEAGYPNGVSIPAWCPSSGQFLPYCESIQAMLREVGINMDIKLIPAVDQWAAWVREESTFGPLWLSPLTPDPSERLAKWFSCGSGLNGARYCNEKVEQLLNQSYGIYDTAKARELTDQIQKIVVDDVPYTFDMWVTIYTGLNKRVQNFVRTPDLNLRLAEVWLQK